MSNQRNSNRLVGKIRLNLGFCPRCNSDAPELYICPVCEFKKVPQEFLWQRFLDWRKEKPLPTFREV